MGRLELPWTLATAFAIAIARAQSDMNDLVCNPAESFSQRSKGEIAHLKKPLSAYASFLAKVNECD
jgi:hypothetical protein